MSGQDRRAAVPGMLDGAWRREVMVHPDGRTDRETWVLWLQHGADFADLRQPAGRPPMAACLNALSIAQMAWLARQNGFAGTLAFDGVFFEWRHEVGFQPPGPAADSATLRFGGETLIEEGRHAPYREDWAACPATTSDGGCLRLRSVEDGRRALVVRHGPWFMVARARADALPAAADLASLLESAGTEAAMRSLVDCEISFGGVGGDGWRIERSTLPYRENALLAPRLVSSRFCEHADLSADGAATTGRWEIAGCDGAEELFAAS